MMVEEKTAYYMAWLSKVRLPFKFVLCMGEPFLTVMKKLPVVPSDRFNYMKLEKLSMQKFSPHLEQHASLLIDLQL